MKIYECLAGQLFFATQLKYQAFHYLYNYTLALILDLNNQPISKQKPEKYILTIEVEK